MPSLAKLFLRPRTWRFGLRKVLSFSQILLKNTEENIQEGKLNLHCCISSPFTLHIFSTMLNPGPSLNTFWVKDNFLQSASISASRIQRDCSNSLWYLAKYMGKAHFSEMRWSTFQSDSQSLSGPPSPLPGWFLNYRGPPYLLRKKFSF